MDITDIVRDHQIAVCATAYGVTGDRALSEDVAQETFVAAWRSIGTLRDSSKLRSWLRGIARNIAYKAQRKRVHTHTEQLGEHAAADDLPSDAIAKEEARIVDAALAGMPATYREVLVLHYWEGLPARRIAEALDISEAAATQRLS